MKASHTYSRIASRRERAAKRNGVLHTVHTCSSMTVHMKHVRLQISNEDNKRISSSFTSINFSNTISSLLHPIQESSDAHL